MFNNPTNMKNIIISLFFIILCSMSFSINANNGDFILQGIAYSEADSLPLIGASVQLLVADSSVMSKTMTDLKGKFEIKYSTTSSASPLYLVKVSFIGHKNFYTSIRGELFSNLDLGSIFLPSNNSLSEVVVNADQTIYKVDRSIIIPGKIEIKASSNSIELLSNMNLPGLTADVINQKATINGLGVVYEINGRQQSREQFLAINPQDILRVEYYDSAPIRYINLGVGGVLNLILKNKLTGGDLFFTGRASPVTGFVDGTLRSSYNIKDSEFSILYNNSLRDYSKRKTYLEESYINALNTIHRVNDGKNAPFGYIDQNVDFGYTYQNKSSMLSAIFKNSIAYTHDENKFNVSQYDFNNQKHFYRESNYNYNFYSPAMDIYYSYKIKENQSIEANLVGTLINSNYKRKLLDDGEITTDNRVDNRRQSITGEVVYKRMFTNLTWSIGLYHQTSHTKNKYTSVTNDVTQMDVHDSYFYTQISGKLDKLLYDVGTGMKFYNVDDKHNNRSHVRNLTTINLAFPFYSDLRLSYRFQLKPNLPSLSQMSDVLQYYDNLTGLQGNPNLKSYNSLTNRILLIYTKKKFKANFWLSYHLSDSPIAASTFYDADKNLFVSMYLNQKKNDKLNTQIDLSLNSLFNHINISVSGGWQKFTSKGKNYYHKLYNLYWYGSLSAYYKKLSLAINYTRPQKSLSAEEIFLFENSSSVMLWYKHKQLSLSAGIFYPFTKDWKSSSWSVSEVNPSYRNVKIRNNGNMLVLGISYNFNFGRNFTKNKKEINNMDNTSGILRAE